VPPTILLPRHRRRDRLDRALLDLRPTALWGMQDATGALRDLTGRWPATVTGTPLYRVAAQPPIDRAITWDGSTTYAKASAVTAPTSMSALCLFRSSSSAANKTILRSDDSSGGTYSWSIWRWSTQYPRFSLYQADNSEHATANAGDAANDGRWRLCVGTFDGTTIAMHVASATSFATASNGTLTGTWNKGALPIWVAAAAGSASLGLAGDTSRQGYWADRVLTATDVRHLASIVFGG
jgi:hypothetical protein